MKITKLVLIAPLFANARLKKSKRDLESSSDDGYDYCVTRPNGVDDFVDGQGLNGESEGLYATYFYGTDRHAKDNFECPDIDGWLTAWDYPNMSPFWGSFCEYPFAIFDYPGVWNRAHGDKWNTILDGTVVDCFTSGSSTKDVFVDFTASNVLGHASSTQDILQSIINDVPFQGAPTRFGEKVLDLLMDPSLKPTLGQAEAHFHYKLPLNENRIPDENRFGGYETYDPMNDELGMDIPNSHKIIYDATDNARGIDMHIEQAFAQPKGFGKWGGSEVLVIEISTCSNTSSRSSSSSSD